MKSNYIPDEIGLKLVDFAKFFDARKHLLRAELKERLKW